jgi:hypothetical protein
MTAQIPDTCTWQGKKWSIKSWDGNRSSIPSNDELEINTDVESSANWSGRIDHFLVYKKKLYLLKIEVNCNDKVELIQPKNAMREVVIRYENRWSDIEGTKRVVKEHRFEYLVFHDLFIPYTGDLFLSSHFFDSWEIPTSVMELDDEDEDEDEDCQEDWRLVFRQGILIDY